MAWSISMTTHRDNISRHYVKELETPLAIFAMDENRICHMFMQPDHFISIPEIKVLQESLYDISDSKPFKLLFDVSDQFVQFDSKARKFAATAPVTELIIAEAVVLNTLPMRMVFNFYLKIDSPTFPTKAFNDSRKAEEWLLTRD